MTNPSTAAQTEDLARFAAALAGQYEVEREIGRGGMGIVYLARDTHLARRVAIKTLPPHLADDPTVRERFLREARTAGGLTHQNIVQIHRADELQGRVFFVMGYVDGDSLAQRIRERGPMDPRELIDQLRDVASALGYAHSQGVIHRDVKAENILIDRITRRAMVTDFGIARLAEAAPLTATGQVLGTVYYLSPEQVSGDAIDARSDIYSLGVVGYFALSGRFPFDAELASAVLIAHVNKSAPPLHSVAASTPRELTDIIDCCLAKDPADRFQSCDELVAALDAADRAIRRYPVSSARAIGETPHPALVSDTEAQAIIGRAANLQARTGLEPRPSPVAMRRDADRDAALTSGYKPADLRDAAVEAGIAAKYVDHAFEEHGLARTSPLEVRPPTLVDRGRSPHAFYGGRVYLEYEVVVDGEIPEDDYDLLVDTLRRATRDGGQLTSVGRSFSWQTQPQKRRNLQVSVLSRGGKTAIRVSENLESLYNTVFALTVMLTTFSSMFLSSIGFSMHRPRLALLMVGGAVAAGYLTARALFSRSSRKRDQEVRSIAEQLAQQARESIAAARSMDE